MYKPETSPDGWNITLTLLVSLVVLGICLSFVLHQCTYCISNLQCRPWPRIVFCITTILSVHPVLVAPCVCVTGMVPSGPVIA